MADQEHLDILKQGIWEWNEWREDNPAITIPELGGADLRKMDLSWANLEGAILIGSDLTSANLYKAVLVGADLSEARLEFANLFGANLRGASLCCAHLWRANLSQANLTEASLDFALIIDADLRDANLTGCSVFGVSVWKVDLEGAIQSKLLITDQLMEEPEITVDNLEVAQFIYLLLHNGKIHNLMETIISKVVLILGRFTPKRKPVLDALRNELRKYNFLPVVFDFDPSTKRDLTETIAALAHMSRFIIADLTNAKSLPQELERIVPHLPSVPVQPILQGGAREYPLFEHYKQYSWVLPVYRYLDTPSLLASIEEKVIRPVEQKVISKGKTKEERIKDLEKQLRDLRQS
jgi:hypothetical protein